MNIFVPAKHQLEPSDFQQAFDTLHEKQTSNRRVEGDQPVTEKLVELST
jgi:hypothetical protein